MTAGLVGLGTLLGLTLLWTADLPYPPIGLWFFALAMSLAWIAGPATDSVMGAVQQDKSGVASAMNDGTRQVAGALGTAGIGSLITSRYSSRVSDAVTGLPADAADSIGQTCAIAAGLPPDQGAGVMEAAADAFTAAMGIGFAVAGTGAVLAAAIVKQRLLAHHRAEEADSRRTGWKLALQPGLPRP